MTVAEAAYRYSIVVLVALSLALAGLFAYLALSTAEADAAYNKGYGYCVKGFNRKNAEKDYFYASTRAYDNKWGYVCEEEVYVQIRYNGSAPYAWGTPGVSRFCSWSSKTKTGGWDDDGFISTLVYTSSTYNSRAACSYHRGIDRDPGGVWDYVALKYR